MSNLEKIFNFALISDKLASSGQPKPEQFSWIKEAGYQLIINLADGTTEYDIAEEPTIVTDLGLAYYNLPVDWENPLMSDLETFFAQMDANQDKKIFVHCIANYRVSAFIMLYRVIKQNIPLAKAKTIKDSVWSPEEVFPIWDDFIALTLKQHGIEE